MKNNKMMLNNMILGELKDGKLPKNSFNVRFDKEILLEMQDKLNNKICLTFLEFFAILDMLKVDVKITMSVKDKVLTFKSNEVLIPTSEIDLFISEHYPISVDSYCLTIPELYSIAKDLEVKIEKI